MNANHKLLARQLARARTADGRLDVEALLALVNSAYGEFDLDRRRSDRANMLMTEELESAHAALQNAAVDLELQNIRFSAALNNMSQGLCLFDHLGRLAVCNDRFLEIYRLAPEVAGRGATLGALLAQSPVFRGMSASERQRRFDEHADMSTTNTARLEQVWPDGRAIAITRNPVEDGGFVDTIADVTESRAAIAKIAHMALHDSLTDLPNRTLFRERVAEALEYAARGEICAVLCLDLDGFKPVNDTLGHAAGDALLLAVAKRLNAGLGPRDTAARLGGDEFALVLRQLGEAAEAVERGSQVIAAVSAPYVIGAQKISIGVSVGVDIVDAACRDPESLVANADFALYNAKMTGRGRCSLFRHATKYAPASRRVADDMDPVCLRA